MSECKPAASYVRDALLIRAERPTWSLTLLEPPLGQRRIALKSDLANPPKSRRLASGSWDASLSLSCNYSASLRSLIANFELNSILQKLRCAYSVAGDLGTDGTSASAARCNQGTEADVRQIALFSGSISSTSLGLVNNTYSVLVTIFKGNGWSLVDSALVILRRRDAITERQAHCMVRLHGARRL